jgi:hypothetical protein
MGTAIPNGSCSQSCLPAACGGSYPDTRYPGASGNHCRLATGTQVSPGYPNLTGRHERIDRQDGGCHSRSRDRAASRNVISWVERLTKTERLRESLFTAATGRRAVEHPPQSGFHRRRGSALSVVNVTGHLPTPRRWGTKVSEEACP